MLSSTFISNLKSYEIKSLRLCNKLYSINYTISGTLFSAPFVGSRKLWMFRIHLQTAEQQSSAVHTLPYILASDLHKRHFSETFKYVIPALSK